MPDQADLFWKGRTGFELRDAALEKFEAQEPRWLQRARSSMVELLQRYPDIDISSDDVWRYCPPPADAHPSVMGAVFKDERFQVSGWQASIRPSAHARVIRTYRLRRQDDGW